MDSGSLTSVLWRRLDGEGHDACRLVRDGEGWRVEGAAVFEQDGRPCGLAYAVVCDRAWRTRTARVTGAVGDDAVDVRIARTDDGRWLLDGVEQAAVAGLVDVDLGFTPATNLIALRRLDLAVGEAAPAPAAYLAFPELRMERLEQTYVRLDATRYRYTSSAYAYDDVLAVSPTGFVLAYPGLWEAVRR